MRQKIGELGAPGRNTHIRSLFPAQPNILLQERSQRDRAGKLIQHIPVNLFGVELQKVDGAGAAGHTVGFFFRIAAGQRQCLGNGGIHVHHCLVDGPILGVFAQFAQVPVADHVVDAACTKVVVAAVVLAVAGICGQRGHVDGGRTNVDQQHTGTLGQRGDAGKILVVKERRTGLGAHGQRGGTVGVHLLADHALLQDLLVDSDIQR